MRFPSYLADEDTRDDSKLVQCPQSSSKGRGRDLADIHGHKSGGEPCTKHMWVSPLLNQQPAETTSQMEKKEDGARVLHPTSHQVPGAWLGTTHTLQRCSDIPRFRALSREAFTLEHTRRSMEQRSSAGRRYCRAKSFLKTCFEPSEWSIVFA